MNYKFCHVQGREREVYGESHRPVFAGLGVAKSGELFGVTQTELNLETELIELGHHLSGESEIGREIDLRLPFGRIVYGDDDIAAQRPAVEGGSDEASLHTVKGELTEHRHVGIFNVHLAVVLLRPSLPGLLLRVCLMRIPEVCVVMQTRYQVKSDGPETVAKVLCRKKCVGGDTRGDFNESFPAVGHREEIPFSEADVLLIPCFGRGSERGRENHAVMSVEIADADGVDLQTVLHGSGHTGPVKTGAGGALPGFLNERGIYDDRHSVRGRENLEYGVLVEPLPVNVPVEGGAVGLLRMHSHSFKLGIVELPGHFQTQAEQLYEDVAETVLHLRRYIFEDRRDGFLGFGGQLCEVHIIVFLFSHGFPPLFVQTVGTL